MCKNIDDAVALGGANPADFDPKSAFGDVDDSDPIVFPLAVEPLGDLRLPSVELKSGVLLRNDVFLFKLLVWPPLLAPAVSLDRLGEQLFAIAFQGGQGEYPDDDCQNRLFPVAS